MIQNKREVAKVVLNLLSSQAFEDWYKTLFEQWLEGGDGAPTDDDMIQWIFKHLNG